VRPPVRIEAPVDFFDSKRLEKQVTCQLVDWLSGCLLQDCREQSRAPAAVNIGGTCPAGYRLLKDETHKIWRIHHAALAISGVAVRDVLVPCQPSGHCQDVTDIDQRLFGRSKVCVLGEVVED